jgi:GNAT superfamily N-acetyltransferase
VKVRDATVADYPAMGRMAKEFESYFLSIGQKPRRKPVDFVKAMTRLDVLDHGGGCLIAEEGGNPAGYLIYFPSVSFGSLERTFNMTDIFVLPTFRDRGVGALLMKKLAEQASQQRVTSIVWTVWDRNPRALDFYLKLGGHPISDEIIMAVETPKLLRKPIKGAKKKKSRA